MKTSSFRTYTGPGRISIARGARFVAPGFKVYRPLAPGRWFNSVEIEEYRELYAKILAGLDPQRTWDELHVLAEPHEPILCCWEVPPFTEETWCHRRQAAEWFEEHLPGVQVPELE
jgi:hypothetical protein